MYMCVYMYMCAYMYIYICIYIWYVFTYVPDVYIYGGCSFANRVQLQY